MPPKVSVVIPAYNAMRFLPRTLESVLQQTFTDYEILIVNDGSNDETEAWLKEQKNDKVHYLTQKNAGLSSARNAGIAATTGEYVAILDADDVWEPSKLAKQVACLEAYPNVGLVHTAIRYIDEYGHEINQPLGVSGSGDVWEQIVVGNCVRCGSTPMIRRSCFNTVGVFDQQLTFSEDWDMWIRIAAHFHFAVINEPLVLYRQHSANMTKSYLRIIPNFKIILARAFNDNPRGSQDLERKAYAHAYLFAAWRAYFARDFQEAASLQRQAFRYYPKIRFFKNSLNLRARLSGANWFGPKSGRNHS